MTPDSISTFHVVPTFLSRKGVLILGREQVSAYIQAKLHFKDTVIAADATYFCSKIFRVSVGNEARRVIEKFPGVDKFDTDNC